MEQAKNRQRQRTFSRTTLADESENFALTQFHGDVAQNFRFVAIVDRKPKA
jgi:hypothetical protein